MVVIPSSVHGFPFPVSPSISPLCYESLGSLMTSLLGTTSSCSTSSRELTTGNAVNTHRCGQTEYSLFLVLLLFSTHYARPQARCSAYIFLSHFVPILIYKKRASRRLGLPLAAIQRNSHAGLPKAASQHYCCSFSVQTVPNR